MVDLFIPEQTDDPVLSGNLLDYTYSDDSLVFNTAIEDALYSNPTTSLFRMGELYLANRSGKKLSKADWTQSEFYREGLTVGEDGITDEAAAVLAERFDYRTRRDQIFSRAQEGFGTTAIMLGGGFLGSMFDPLAVGAAIVPGIAVGRLASSATQTGRLARAAKKIDAASAANRAKYGATATRLVEGGLIGGAEAALFEPLIYGAAKHEQDDTYGAMDSFMNIVFGTVLGGGLHAVTGKVGDMTKRASPQTVNNALQTSVGELVTTGQVRGAAKIIEADVQTRPAGVFARRLDPQKNPGAFGAPPRGMFEEDIIPEVKGVAYPEILRPILPSNRAKLRPQTLRQAVLTRGGIDPNDPNLADLGEAAKGIKRSRAKGGVSIDEIGLRLTEEGYFDGRVPDGERPTVAQIIDAIVEDYDSSDGKTLHSGRFFSPRDPRLPAFIKAEDLFEEARMLEIDPKGMRQEDFYRVLAQKQDFELRAMEANSRPDEPSQEQIDSSIADAEAAGYRGIEFSEFSKMMRELDAEPEYTPVARDADDIELTAMIEDIKARVDNGELDSSEVAEYLAEADNIIRQAENHDSLAHQAVACITGKSFTI
jgi:hypothetical protein